LSCNCCRDESAIGPIAQKLLGKEQELIDAAKKFLNKASDPFSGVINFLHDHPEDSSLPGLIVNRVLLGAFGDTEKIPGLIRVLASHVHEIARKSDVINIINEHPAVEKWGQYLIKQKEKIAFKVSHDKGNLLLNDIVGLVAVEHGVEPAQPHCYGQTWSSATTEGC
jgi:hypothetical protein